MEEVYEQDLHQAILMSKLAYDVQLENAKKSDKDTEQAKKGNSKKGKRATMSLEEFNNLGVNGSQSSTAKTVVKEEKSGGMFPKNTLRNKCSNGRNLYKNIHV